jgi:hypothetical protein
MSAVNPHHGGFAPYFRFYRWTTWKFTMNPKTSLFSLLLVIVGLCCPVKIMASAQASPDTILFNGRIFTGDDSQSRVQSLAITGKRISAIGDDAAIKSLAGPKTRQVDLGGRTVIPGINDAHDHIYVTPRNTVALSFKQPDPTWSEVQNAIKQAVTASPPGSILSGEFETAIYFNPAVNRTALDKIAPAHAVILSCVTGHALIVNSVALKELGIAKDIRDPAGGRYERSNDGDLNGIIREYATLQINRKLTDLTGETDAVKQLRLFYRQAVQYGITSIQDMSDAFTPQRIVTLLEKSASPLRIRVMRMPPTAPSGRDLNEGLHAVTHPAALITVSGTKWMLDGTPLEGTLTPPGAWHAILSGMDDRAWMELPLTFEPSEMKSMLRESLQNNDQLMVHVSGYPAASAMLRAMQETGGVGVWAGKRVRFEHGDGLFPDLVPLAKRLGIIVVQNPTHFSAVSKADKAFPLKSLLAAGIPVALGSDGPLNPYLNIMLASTHPAHPAEAITREQAVIAYTRTSAYAEFAEHDKGTLVPGRLADLAVLSQDIFTIPQSALPKTESILTLVGGEIVYDAGQLH